MSRVTMTMPQLGETMEHGIVAQWLVQEGEAFSRGDPIIEFETDKTAVEYPALGSGVLVEQSVNEGDQVNVGEPIAIVDIGEGPNWLNTDDTDNTGLNDVRSVDQEAVIEVDGSRAPEVAEPQSTPNTRATPAARKLARQSGMDINAIAGTGRRGRIEQHDVQQAVGSAGADAVTYIGDLALHDRGPAEGKTYLLLHGFAADHSAWALLARAMSRAGCRAVAVDLPGHGKSRSAATDVESLSVGLDAVLDAVTADRSCHIVAHSMGALPAVQLALAQLEENAKPAIGSLTLIAPAGLGVSVDGQFIEGMAAPSSRAEVTHLLRKLSAWPQSLSPGSIDALYEQLGQGRLRELAASLASDHKQRVDIHDALGRVASRIPVKIIMGHADRIFDWHDVLHVHPRVAVHHLPSAGHVPHWDEPRTVADIILSAEH